MRKIAIEYLFILRLTSRRMMTNKKSLCFVFKLKKTKIYSTEFLKIHELIFKEETPKY